MTVENFYVVARESGAEHPSLPTWATRVENPLALAAVSPCRSERVDLDQVPGAFQLLNLLSPVECERLITLSEALGYLPDAAVSLPRSVRHNYNVTWVADDATTDLLWRRCEPLMREKDGIFDDKKALGLNARFRFYRYQPGDYFAPHTDGSWPGSRVIDGQLVANAYPDRWSQMSFLLFLSDGYEGGSTRFYLDPDSPGKPASDPQQARIVGVRTPAGAALFFPHGNHALHCLHGSEPIVSGSKYIIRSDLLFEI